MYGIYCIGTYSVLQLSERMNHCCVRIYVSVSVQVGGRMVIPVGPEWQQELLIVDRKRESDADIVDLKKDFEIRSLLDVRYVPLVPPSSSPME